MLKKKYIYLRTLPKNKKATYFSIFKLRGYKSLALKKFFNFFFKVSLYIIPSISFVHLNGVVTSEVTYNFYKNKWARYKANKKLVSLFIADNFYKNRLAGLKALELETKSNIQKLFL